MIYGIIMYGNWLRSPCREETLWRGDFALLIKEVTDEGAIVQEGHWLGFLGGWLMKCRWKYVDQRRNRQHKMQGMLWYVVSLGMISGDTVQIIIELDDGKIYRKTLYLMVKTMVSCRFSLKPIHWDQINWQAWQLKQYQQQPLVEGQPVGGFLASRLSSHF